jgi:quinohemoprotein ethanol dehydrogenase
MAFVNTNNKDPYSSPCTPGPDLWAASVLALNDTTGQWIWGFQATPHDLWDYDCSWWQALANETINGAQTQVLFKTCKDGYLYELNAKTGNLIWAYTPPQNVLARCNYCFMLNPLNASQMDQGFFNPSLNATLMYPSELAGFENEGAYNPVLNYIFIASQNVPLLAYNVPANSTNYKTNSGIAFFPPPGATASTGTQDNTTITAVDAATGKAVWTHFIALQGYRGGVTTSGNLVFIALSSGDLQILDAQNGTLLKDLYIGGPLNELATVGATINGTTEVIIPITAGLVSWGTTVPGDIIAMSLQNLPVTTSSTTSKTSSTSSASSSASSAISSTSTSSASSAASASSSSSSPAPPSGSTSITTVVSTMVSVSTVTSSPSSNNTALYAVAAVAVIFIIATGYLAATRGRRPAT